MSSNIQIHTKDGDFFNLPDISYDKFVQFLSTKGASDTEYDIYLKMNNMIELSDFYSEVVEDMSLIYEDKFRGRVIHFKAVYDSEKDLDFDEEEYFGW